METFVVDAHLDLAWNALQWNRDITQSVYTIRTQEASEQGPGRARNTVSLPEMQRGNIRLCIATLMGRRTATPVAHVDYRSPTQTYAMAQGHLAYYHALEHRGFARIIKSSDQLTELTQGIASKDANAIGFVIGMESADGILDPDQVPEWYNAGVRVIGPAHYGMGRYAGGTGVEDGFTDQGFALLDAMQSHRIALDLTHLSDRAFWEAMERYEGVILASHSNCRALVPAQRQLDDTQIKAIAARDGVIGMAFDVWMLCDGWIKGQSTNAGISLADIADHIDHICQMTGNAKHVGIGSDLDGGFGKEQSPSDLDTIADIQKLVPLLQQRGYQTTDIEAILHGNWLRIFRRILETP